MLAEKSNPAYQKMRGGFGHYKEGPTKKAFLS
jgi:hypothetical protein